MDEKWVEEMRKSCEQAILDENANRIANDMAQLRKEYMIGLRRAMAMRCLFVIVAAVSIVLTVSLLWPK